jgi:hypothetical protein
MAALATSAFSLPDCANIPDITMEGMAASNKEETYITTSLPFMLQSDFSTIFLRNPGRT